MTVSALRTLVVGPSTSAFGVRQPTLRWPMAEPTDVLDYSLDVSLLIADVGDVILSASIEISPSGNGEMEAKELSLFNDVITGLLSGGVAGRLYTIRIQITTVGDLSFSWLVGLPIDAELMAYPLISPPDQGFGVPLPWTSMNFDLSDPQNSGHIALLAGF